MSSNENVPQYSNHEVSMRDVLDALRENTRTVSSMGTHIDEMVKQHEKLEKRVALLEKTSGSDWLKPMIDRIDRSVTQLIDGQNETFKMMGSKADRTELLTYKGYSQNREHHSEDVAQAEEHNQSLTKVRWISIGIAAGSLVVGLSSLVASLFINGAV